uniref:Uncharacterized protein MANES_04G122600 n=1 Tax=Rhizophora mucronata TaxID=61149 RepID=A0A2P2MLY1_RHIMU
MFFPLFVFRCALGFLQQPADENGEQNVEEQDGEEGSQEEAVDVDADSTDGVVLVNGNEAQEEWVLTPHH